MSEIKVEYVQPIYFHEQAQNGYAVPVVRVEAVRELYNQIMKSNAIDDHGHAIKNLRVVCELGELLAALEGKG